ncbi:MAG: GyrI-like domain-containing protein [Anaerolineae bacterium]|nr:GyrI-like domain-containing protein [Anaerolineae bacterium]
MEKRDFRKELKQLYNPPTRQVSAVIVPPMNFLMVDGAGDPNQSQPFAEATEALYSLSYTLKFASKAAGIDYGVMPLEGLWWVEGNNFDLLSDRSLWRWTLMIMQPDPITPERVTSAVAEVRRKKNPPALDRVRFECYDEGLVAQLMHIGPYSAEMPNVERVHNYIIEQGNALVGRHHEIYVGDPNRTAPEKLKTILRQPMRPA